MPTLPPCLRRPHPWLGMLALIAALCGLDLLRQPRQQVLAHGYAGCIGAYQWARPRLGIAPCCRYVPSCSHYSVQAVERYGLLRGLKLSVSRIDRCRTNIPRGTPDPLPDEREAATFPGVPLAATASFNKPPNFVKTAP